MTLTEFARAAACIRDADALVICTGAGMGVDSGLGTFRGRMAGIWPPLKALGKDFSELSTPAWFESDPRLAWAFWHFRHQGYTKSDPHAGYDLLTKWGVKLPFGVFSVTSNIDGHWERTPGIGPELIYECHGALTHMQYVREQVVPDEEAIWRTDDEAIASLDVPQYDIAPGEIVEARLYNGSIAECIVEEDLTLKLKSSGKPVRALAVMRPGGEDLMRVREGSPLPTKDGLPTRPNVLMFGDYGVKCDRIDEQSERFQAWLQKVPKDGKLVIIEVGAGTAVQTIRYIGENTAKLYPNSTFIRVNLEDASVSGLPSSRTISIEGLGALAALTAIDAQM
mmetsp:Transcript_87582/g.192353  ORF Transcript_87582/g.192353 Transcript_87582/m.192353 type:complete len:338 (+) Transcript_87582:59-1072(+)